MKTTHKISPGDKIYGLDQTTKGAGMGACYGYTLRNQFAIDNGIPPDDYFNHTDDHEAYAIDPFNNALKGAHDKKKLYPPRKSENKNVRQFYKFVKEVNDNEDPFPQAKNWISKGCKLGVLYTLSRGKKVHFLLDFIDFKAVFKCNPEDEYKYNGYTAKELRFIYRNWKYIKELYPNQIVFYKNNQIVDAPWESNNDHHLYHPKHTNDKYKGFFYKDAYSKQLEILKKQIDKYKKKYFNADTKTPLESDFKTKINEFSTHIADCCENKQKPPINGQIIQETLLAKLPNSDLRPIDILAQKSTGRSILKAVVNVAVFIGYLLPVVNIVLFCIGRATRKNHNDSPILSVTDTKQDKRKQGIINTLGRIAQLQKLQKDDNTTLTDNIKIPESKRVGKAT